MEGRRPRKDAEMLKESSVNLANIQLLPLSPLAALVFFTMCSCTQGHALTTLHVTTILSLRVTENVTWLLVHWVLMPIPLLHFN